MWVGVFIADRHRDVQKHWIFWMKCIISVTIALFGNWQTVVMAWK